MKSILFLLRHDPGSAQAKEALDMLLMFCAFVPCINIVLMDKAIGYAVPSSQTKTLTEILAAYSMATQTNCYLDKVSLDALGGSISQGNTSLHVVTPTELQHLLQQQDSILSF